MALFGALFGLMRWLSVHPIGFAAVGIFVAGIGVAQAVLFGGKQPRAASIVAGSFFCPVICLVIVLGIARAQGGFFADNLSLVIVGVLFGAILVGAELGYAAGCLVAAVFLGGQHDAEGRENGRVEAVDPLVAESVEDDGNNAGGG
jgi:hypothetical protein